MELVGIIVRNFGSVGPEGVALDPLRRCNVLIGQNNSGKSHVLRAVGKALALSAQGNPRSVPPLKEAEWHRLSRANLFEFTLKYACDPATDSPWHTVATDGVFDISFKVSGDKGQVVVSDYSPARAEFGVANALLRQTSNKYFPERLDAERMRKELMEEAPQLLSRIPLVLPKVHFIPEFREIRDGEEYGFGGTGLIARLASWQHPDFGKHAERGRFERVQDFLRRLLHLPDAKLEVDHAKTALLLEHSGLRLPLASYGTGVHELAILATAICSEENAIFCVEEPEIHLHPRLQREFVDFLANDPSRNTFFLSTHSPALINVACSDPKRFALIHLSIFPDGAAIGSKVLDDAEAARVLIDLGIRPSDLLQANCVIWVEGPSDRVYLNRWIQLVANDLVEGVHYSIVFYGGKILSHLGITWHPVPDELVNVLRVNRHAVVLIDRDRKNADSEVNQTKLRIEQKCLGSGALCWITDGREIENYIPEALLNKVLSDIAGTEVVIKVRPFDRVPRMASEALQAVGTSMNAEADKVGFARKVATAWTLEHFGEELRGRVESVCAKIRA